MARKSPESINRLVLSQQFALLKYMETNYVSSGLLDTEFAVKASADLNIPLTAANIHGSREALGFKSNRDLKREQAKQPRNRLEHIEQRLEKLESMAKELGWKI
jgi:hypothetical protein